MFLCGALKFAVRRCVGGGCLDGRCTCVCLCGALKCAVDWCVDGGVWTGDAHVCVYVVL